jgi:hypothetical protein
MLSFSVPTGLLAKISLLPGSVGLVLGCALPRLCGERGLSLCVSEYRCVSRDSGSPDVWFDPFPDSDRCVCRAGRLWAGVSTLGTDRLCVVVLLALRPLSFFALSSKVEDILGGAARRLGRQA